MSSTNPNAQHDGKSVISRVTGGRRIKVESGTDADGAFLIHYVPEEDLTAQMCACPACFNTFSHICAESGGQCIPITTVDGDETRPIFCRAGDTISSGAFGQSYPNILTANKPQKYTPDEVKSYYPYWESLLDFGWDENSDLWLDFQGTLTQVGNTYVWNGPPTKQPVERIDYRLYNPLDFQSPDDKKPVELFNANLLDCEGHKYVIQGDSVCSGQSNPVLLLQNDVLCNTSSCRCEMSKGEYKQWKKDNNRESPYYYIRAKSPSGITCSNDNTGPNNTVRQYVVQSGWCYGEVLEPARPAGLYTQCSSWSPTHRCSSVSQAPGIGKELLYKCCEVPPSIVGWFTFAGSRSSQNHSSYPVQPARIDNTNASYREGVSNAFDGVFVLNLLWDDNTTSLIYASNQLPHTWESGEPVFDPNGVFNNGNSAPPYNYIQKCCNRFYYKLQLTPGTPKSWNWPSGIGPGFGKYWLLKSINIHLWMSSPVVRNDVGFYKDPGEDNYYKILEQELQLQFNPFGEPDTYCSWDEENEICSGTSNCGQSINTGYHCRPFLVTGGQGASTISTMSGYYGMACRIPIDTNNSTTRNPTTNPLDNRTSHWLNYGMPHRRYFCTSSAVAVDRPVCYYKDCLRSMGVLAKSLPENPTDYQQWEERRAKLVEQNQHLTHPIGGLPVIHGGFCKWSVVNDDTKICGTCQSPYIRCTHKDSPYNSENSFMPRLCGDTKCIHFEMR